MKKYIRNTFLPNTNNSQRPYLFGPLGAVAVSLAAFALFGLAVFHGQYITRHAGDNLGAVIAAVLIEQANSERSRENINGLNINERLVASAQLKADHMAENSYFAHNSPNGLTPWHWFREAGYAYTFAGENLAVNFRDSTAVTRAWMNSPTHRANILNGNYSEIGIATASGRYKGQNTVFVVQHFGEPRADDPLRDLELYLSGGEEESVDEEIQMEAQNQLAAIGSAGALSEIMVQPAKLYRALFILLGLAVMGFLIYTLRHKQKEGNRRQLVLYGFLILVIIATLGTATVDLLSNSTEIIEGELVEAS